MARQYCTIENIEDYMSVDIAADFETTVESWIEWMSLYIENQTGKVFIADSSNSEKIYEINLERSVSVGGTNKTVKELVVHDFVNTSTSSMKLTIDDEELDDDEFLLYPATIEELPKTKLVLKKDVGDTFTKGEQNIKVEAKWGHSISAPDDITFATIVLVSGMINTSWSSEGEMSSVSLGRYTMSFKDQKQLQDFDRVQDILKLYFKQTV